MTEITERLSTALADRYKVLNILRRNLRLVFHDIHVPAENR